MRRKLAFVVGMLRLASVCTASVHLAKDVVVAHHDEAGAANFLRVVRPGVRVFVYSKGRSVPAYLPPNATTVERLDNVGRCDHTFATHIARHYNNLAPCITFVKASGTLNARQLVSTLACRPSQGTRRWHPVPSAWCGRHQRAFASHTLKACELTRTPGLATNLTTLREFNAFASDLFGTPKPVRRFLYGGVFETTAAAVRCHPAALYAALAAALAAGGRNPQFAHVVERLWGHLFVRRRNACDPNLNATRARAVLAAVT